MELHKRRYEEHWVHVLFQELRKIRNRQKGRIRIHTTIEAPDTGTVCSFWMTRKLQNSVPWIRMFLGLPDPDPLVRGTVRTRIRILLSSSKNSKKSLYCYGTVLWLLHDIISLKYDVNVTSKINKQKNFEKEKNILLPSWRSLTKIEVSGSGSVSQRYGFATLPQMYLISPLFRCQTWAERRTSRCTSHRKPDTNVLLEHGPYPWHMFICYDAMSSRLLLFTTV